MRHRRWLAVPTVLMLLLAACGDDDDDGEEGGDTGTEGGAEQAEDTGSVNLMSAGEPEEVDAYQEIFDELINSETDYTVEIESVATSRSSSRSGRGRHPRRGRCPSQVRSPRWPTRARSCRSRTWASTSRS